MSTFKQSVIKVFQGAFNTFKTFPAANACALAFAIVTMVRIQLDWPQQEAYNFLFNCLHLGFATGAVSSLATITAAKSRFEQKRAFLVANLLGGLAATVTFALLYVFGGRVAEYATSTVLRVTELSASRVSVAILVSLIAFIYLAGYPKEQSDFGRSLFMFHKALIIAMIYGAVIMSGTSGVAGAVQALLYRNMSEKVYMYLATITGFLAFTIFVGYFPDFSKGKIDEHRDIAQKHPRFIEVLFQYIMVPIALALTVVLLLWTGKTVLSGTWPSFLRLSGIATSYAAGGIWLHVMVTRYEDGLAKFFRKVYPLAALLILAFEARALLIQLGISGLKMAEYAFILIWILAVAAAVLLIMRKQKAHPYIAALVCAIAIFSVLPGVGFHALPVTAQVNRLEDLLIGEGMLVAGQLTPAVTEPEEEVRESITDAVDFLAGADESKLPSWFDKDLRNNEVFLASMGFEQTWPKPDYEDIGPREYMETYLRLPNTEINISGYDWAVMLQEYDGRDGSSLASFEGQNGRYIISWIRNTETEIPAIEIELDGRMILEQDMRDYLKQITEKYPPNQEQQGEGTVDDLTLVLETEEVKVLLVFRYININLDPSEDDINYWMELSMLYLEEK